MINSHLLYQLSYRGSLEVAILRGCRGIVNRSNAHQRVISGIMQGVSKKSAVDEKRPL